MLKIFILVSLCLPLICSLAFGQQKYDLTMGLREGQSWTFDQVTEGVQTSNMSAEGQPPVQGEQRMRQVRKGTITVLAVDGGIPTQVKVDFDRVCVTKMKMGGQEQEIEFPFAGSTVTITRDVKGQVTNDFKGQADPMAVMELGSYLMANNSGFARKPVAVDEQWEPDLAEMRRGYQLTDDDKVVGVSKIVSIAPIAGRQAAEVITYLKINKRMGEMEMTSELKGSIWYDLETGNMLQSSMDGATAAQGMQEMPGMGGQMMRVNVKNAGQTQFRLETKPLSMGKSDAGPTVAVTTPETHPPTAIASVAGSYKGANLALELSGRDGRYTGTVSLGERTFPLTAEESAGQLKGTFKSGDESYPFTAKLSGDEMVFATGRTEYKLRKQRAAPPNPLDTSPGAPANPLDSTPPASRVAAPADVELGQYTLPDPYLGVTAWTFVAPTDWKKEGGVSWTGSLTPGPAYSTSLEVRSPDGSTQFSMLPTLMFVQTQNPMFANGQEMLPVMDALTCIREVILPRCRPGARDLKIIAADALPKMAAADKDEALQSGLEAAREMDFNSGRAHVTYTLQGRQLEEMIYCTIVSAPRVGGAVGWVVDHGFSYRAEKGKLQASMPVLATIASSVKANPQWVSARRQELARIVAENSRPPRVNAGSGGTLSILDVSKSMARDQDDFLKGLDASSRLREQAMSQSYNPQRNTEMTIDPVTQERLEVSSGYLHHYRDYYGQVHGSDLNASDFYVQYKIPVTELEPTRR